MSQNIWGSDETQFFFNLTPDIILDAMEGLGYEITGRCLVLASMENRVYEVEIEVDENLIQSASDRFIITKFYRPGRWSREQILEEHEFLFDLQAEDIPVIAPIRVDGESLFTLDNGIHYCVFPKKGGRAPQEMNDEQLQSLGRQIARLHIVGASKKAKHRLSLNTENFVTNNSEYLFSHQKIPLHLESTYKQLISEITLRTQKLFKELTNLRIHGDCHWGNVISRDEEGMFFIDFDDMLVGPSVQDLWLINPTDGDEGKRQFNLMLEAYESMRHFDDRELKLIEPLRAYRYIHFSAWIAKRWEDPAFQRAFPHYGDERYWQTQIRDLEEQLLKIT